MATPKTKKDKNFDAAPPRETGTMTEAEQILSFCRAASHELGNVLGTIVGELDYGLTNTNTLVRYRAMNVALAAAERAISLARNLSYFAVHPKLEIQATDLSQLIMDTIEMVEKDLRNRHIKFNVLVEAARTVEVDPPSVQQVLLNLFRRASETMPQGGNLTVGMRQHGSKLEISLSDTGVGIPQERLDALLTTELTDRNGPLQVQDLELTVAKTLVERQGGTLKIQSIAGEGTTYKLLFPFDPQATRSGKNFTELRRFRRVHTNLAVEVSFDRQSPFLSEIQTLSTKGCFIAVMDTQSTRLPPIESTGSLRIHYYQDQVLDIAKCRIANHTRNGRTVGIGIEFIEVDSRSRKLLDAIVKSHSF